MKIARRTFLLGAGVFVASPVLANLPPTAHEGARALSPPLPLPLQPPAEPAEGTDLVFKIDGWSVRNTGMRVSAHDEVWFTVNHLWRTAWR